MEKINKTIKQKIIRKRILDICQINNKDKKFNKLFGYLGITLGTMVMASGTALFLLPNELSTGGFSGIATIIYYLFNIPLGRTIIVLNMPLFIIAYFKISKGLFFKSIYGTISLSTFIDLFNKHIAITNDKFLACIYGGILVGIGSAIILKFNASTGGSDLLSYVIRTYKPKYRSSNLILIIDVVIIAFNVLFFKKIEVGLYSAIAIYLMSKMIDIIFEGTNFTKLMFIISPKYKEISKAISNNINRGSTGIYSKGMYTNEEKMMLLCVGSRTEAYRMQDIARKIDESAFVIIINAREVLGKGFK